MTLAELIALFREQADDNIAEDAAHLWPDAEIIGHLAEAEAEACIRAGLLVDEKTRGVAVLTVRSDQSWLNLDPTVLDVERAVLASTGQVLFSMTPDRLDRAWPGWESVTGTPDRYYLDGARLRLIPRPTTADTLTLRVRRTPLSPLVADDLTAEPEITSIYHRGLVDWALYRAYSKRDADTFNPTSAQQYLADFETRFGPRPSGYAQRKQRERRQHRVRFNQF